MMNGDGTRCGFFIGDGTGVGKGREIAAEEGVSPGQACVFYAREGTRVLGGGWIWRGR